MQGHEQSPKSFSSCSNAVWKDSLLHCFCVSSWAMEVLFSFWPPWLSRAVGFLRPLRGAWRAARPWRRRGGRRRQRRPSCLAWSGQNPLGWKTWKMWWWNFGADEFWSFDLFLWYFCLCLYLLVYLQAFFDFWLLFHNNSRHFFQCNLVVVCLYIFTMFAAQYAGHERLQLRRGCRVDSRGWSRHCGRSLAWLWNLSQDLAKAIEANTGKCWRCGSLDWRQQVLTFAFLRGSLQGMMWLTLSVDVCLIKLTLSFQYHRISTTPKIYRYYIRMIMIDTGKE